MRIEKYQGRDTKEVMARVRAELGADAYILRNRRVGDRVELTVAQDIDALINGEVPAAARTLPADPTRVRGAPVGKRSAVEGPESGARARQFLALEKELDRLRGILESELGERSWRDVAGQRPVVTTLRQRLLRLGLSRRLAGAVLERVPRDATLDQAWRLVRGALARRLRTAELSDAADAVTALYGGTGVGKTSTLAKLAGRDIRRLGPRSVGLITLDSYRIGAQEQLATFADALGLPLLSADNAAGLAAALRKLRGRRIYIDTAGMSQRDERLRAQLDLVAAACPRAEHLVVLAASTQAAQNRALVQAFDPETLSGAIIAKVDEAQTLGGVIDVVLQADLALYGVADGQRVPEDFHAADGAELLAEALRRAPPGQTASEGREGAPGYRVRA
jgi:flagellar biosynthesis protein FlhF